MPALLCASAVVACIQPLDRAAAGGSSTDGLPATVSDFTSPSADLGTPPIDLEDGATTDDGCVRTRERALAIRQTYCASCHAPPAKMGGFDSVLDEPRLVAAVSGTALNDAGQPQRLVIPGDARGSSLFQRVIHGQMPPVVAPPLPPNPAPTVSDYSALEEWIDNCLGEKPARPATPPAPDGGDAGSDGGDAVSDGGIPRDAGSG